MRRRKSLTVASAEQEKVGIEGFIYCWLRGDNRPPGLCMLFNVQTKEFKIRRLKELVGDTCF